MGCNGLHQAPATWIGAFAFQCSTAHAFKFKSSGPCTASQSIQCSVSKMFRLVMCIRVVFYFGRNCLSLKSEIFRILNLKFIFFSPTRVPNMGPFSGPESGQPKRGTHSNVYALLQLSLWLVQVCFLLAINSFFWRVFRSARCGGLLFSTVDPCSR